MTQLPGSIKNLNRQVDRLVYSNHKDINNIYSRSSMPKLFIKTDIFDSSEQGIKSGTSTFANKEISPWPYYI